MKEYRSPRIWQEDQENSRANGIKGKEFAAIIEVGDQMVYHWEKEAYPRGSYICPGEWTFTVSGSLQRRKVLISMTHEEQRIWLIRELQKEETELSHYSHTKR